MKTNAKGVFPRQMPPKRIPQALLMGIRQTLPSEGEARCRHHKPPPERGTPQRRVEQSREDGLPTALRVIEAALRERKEKEARRPFYI